MGRKTTQNFNKRYEDRISVTYCQRSIEPEEAEICNASLLKAFNQVLAGELKREPTPDELLGISEIRLSKPKKQSQL